MKKLFAMLLTLALSLSLLVGCGSAPSEPAAPSGNAAPSAEASAPAESGKKLQVGIVQVMEHPSLDQIRTSFLDEMARLGYGEDKVDYDYQNASGDTSNLNTICQKFAGDQKDLIVAIATPSRRPRPPTRRRFRSSSPPSPTRWPPSWWPTPISPTASSPEPPTRSRRPGVRADAAAHPGVEIGRHAL